MPHFRFRKFCRIPNVPMSSDLHSLHFLSWDTKSFPRHGNSGRKGCGVNNLNYQMSRYEEPSKNSRRIPNLIRDPVTCPAFFIYACLWDRSLWQLRHVCRLSAICSFRLDVCARLFQIGPRQRSQRFAIWMIDGDYLTHSSTAIVVVRLYREELMTLKWIVLVRLHEKVYIVILVVTADYHLPICLSYELDNVRMCILIPFEPMYQTSGISCKQVGIELLELVGSSLGIVRVAKAFRVERICWYDVGMRYENSHAIAQTRWIL